MSHNERFATLDSLKKNMKDEQKQREAVVSSSQAVELFKSAQESGAEVEKNKPAKDPFSSKGYRLGGFFSPTFVVPPKKVTLAVKLWEDGFSIEDGPLRRFDAPENTEFMSEVKRGVVPKELVQEHRGSKLDVRVMQMGRKFPNPKRRVSFVEEEKHEKVRRIVPFSGKGRVLGSPCTEGDAPEAQEKKKVPGLSSSAILIRLPDGRRFTVEFRDSDKVADLRNYILRMNPLMENRSFLLINGATKKVILDRDVSLAKEGLFKALVIVRFCKE